MPPDNIDNTDNKKSILIKVIGGIIATAIIIGVFYAYWYYYGSKAPVDTSRAEKPLLTKENITESLPASLGNTASATQLQKSLPVPKKQTTSQLKTFEKLSDSLPPPAN